MVGSSIIAAWSDISTTLARLSEGIAVVDPTSGAEVPLPSSVIGNLNAGYVWMFINCVASACYVGSRRNAQIPANGVIGPIHEKEDKGHRIQGLGFDVLQQPVVDSSVVGILDFGRGLERKQFSEEFVSQSLLKRMMVTLYVRQPRTRSDAPSHRYCFLRGRSRFYLILHCMVCPNMWIYHILDGRSAEQVGEQFVPS
jgi:hypothetical protein